MGATSLAHFFQPAGQRRALEAYGKFAGSSDWSVSHKMDLYEGSRVAFGPATPEGEGLRAFEHIYNSLVSHWQVFRPHGVAGSWSAATTYQKIKSEFAAFAWGGPSTLPTLHGSGKHQDLMFSLMEMEKIKPNSGYPTMTVSKFLHFYNPALFPIYDTEVIWNKVFKRFKADYDRFRTAANLVSRAGDVAFLRNYMCWASSLMASAHPAFMATFVDWLAGELPPRKFEALGREMLGTLYATAFEFTAIGAACVDQG
jgi:hypothetical protein